MSSSEVDSDEIEIEFEAKLATKVRYTYSYVDLETFYQVCQHFSFPLLEIINERGKIVKYALRRDHARLISRNAKGEDVWMDKDIADVTFITKAFIKSLKGPPKSVDAYVFQKLMWNERRKELFEQLRKKPEFELVSELMLDTRIHGMCTFHHQKVIMGYKADCLFLIKPALLHEGIQIPELVLEIDENGHEGYDKEDEKRRSELIQSFGYRLIRVTVPRSCTPKSLSETIKKTADKIVTILSDLIIQYTPEITTEQFIREAEAHDIDRDLLALYLPSTENKRKGPFFIPLDSVGEYLGYFDEKNGSNNLKNLVNKYLNENEHFEVTTDFQTGTTLKIPEGKRPRGRPRKLYYLSRFSFHLICIHSRKENSTLAQIKLAKLSVVALDYAKKIKAQLLLQNKGSSATSKVETINKRIKELKEKDVTKKNNLKLRKEVKEKDQKISELEKDVETLKQEAEKNRKIHLSL